jgi:hypothetical protein
MNIAPLISIALHRRIVDLLIGRTGMTPEKIADELRENVDFVSDTLDYMRLCGVVTWSFGLEWTVDFGLVRSAIMREATEILLASL